MNQLTKQSSDSEIKRYFTAVLKLAKSREQFPVNLEEVWPLVYGKNQMQYKHYRGILLKMLITKFCGKIRKTLMEGGRSMNTNFLFLALNILS